ncbi:MAG: alkaline shock response membrane anchor protein AmaP [Actinomycetota bacterium]|nr:alkaline shock response membrane anchor protein AmaP [Actinomycetota bacterium]
MRTFNRLIMILLLVGLALLGVFAVVYSFDLLGYKLANLPVGPVGDSVSGFVDSIESGPGPLTIAILALVAILGLVLLIMELKPRTPRKVKMQEGTYMKRDVVEKEVSAAAESTPNILDSSTKVKARRKPGAEVKLDANIRRGEDQKQIQSDLRQRIEDRLSSSGAPVSKLKIRMIESDPRETKTRVQ